MVTSIRSAPAATLRKAAHIQRLLEPGAIQPVYQPIVRLSDLQPVGYEGLARFPYAPGLSNLPPDVTLAAASEIGLRDDLEVACWAAMASAGSPPSGRLLFVNISPDALGHPGLFALATKLPSRLVIEITEQREVTDYGELRDRLAPWIARGAALAIDDTGAGYASLEHVVELRPDFLKLTRGLVAEIDRDANRQALLRALMAFAREVGAVIVAEGVERKEELEILRECEVDFAQGWLFGKPGQPWPEVPQIEPPSKERPKLTESGLRRVGKLEHAIANADGIREACEAVVDHLGRMGFLPSVYVEQGGRLRCAAARGYWMLYDGIPTDAGVVGRTFREGKTIVVGDVSKEGNYLSMVKQVAAEVCVPLRLGQRIVGVINVESTTPMGDGPVREIERVAVLLAKRLSELQPLDRPTPGQRLARAAARAANLTEPNEVIREALQAALDVSGLESVALVMVEGARPPHVHQAVGPFAETFTAMTALDLAAMADWVAAGSTCVTMGDAAGKGPACTEALRRSGAGALGVFQVSVADRRFGFLALADRSTVVLKKEVVELLELLCVQTAAQLRGLEAVDELRERAARDPLTGLGHHGAFHARLGKRRAEADAHGRRLAVVLADIDELGELNERSGHAAGDDILRAVASLLQEVAPEHSHAYRLGDDEFALVMETEGRGPAQEIAWQLQAQARDRLGTTLSIGVALADGDESDTDLVNRADQALAEVKRRGRDGVALAQPAMPTGDESSVRP